jgi:L-lactate permease
MIGPWNRESRGRRPRLSCKEEKKRFRPSESENTAADRQSLGGCLTPTLRNPYAECRPYYSATVPPHALRRVPRSYSLLLIILLMIVFRLGRAPGGARRAGRSVRGRPSRWPPGASAPLGLFVTGSSTSSKVVFGRLQRRTAELKGLRASILLAAQNGGSAIGSEGPPSKLLVGANTVTVAGRMEKSCRPRPRRSSCSSSW